MKYMKHYYNESEMLAEPFLRHILPYIFQKTTLQNGYYLKITTFNSCILNIRLINNSVY